LKDVLRDALAIDVGAAMAVQVGERRSLSVELHLAVNARDLAVGELRLGLPASAEKEGSVFAQRKRPSLIRSIDDMKLLGHIRISVATTE
jgi:hypothetical protein